MAHILPHWTWPSRVGQVTPVHVFTSGDEAELFVNGKSAGRQKTAKSQYRLRWDNVTYQAGDIRVVAYRNGAKWAEDSKKTVGSATKLNVTADRTTISNDGYDLSFVTVAVVDGNGDTVPQARNSINFSISGPGQIVSTDNGDPTDMTAFPSLTRQAFSGFALAIVRSKPGASGSITVSAASNGLTGGQVTVQTDVLEQQVREQTDQCRSSHGGGSTETQNSSAYEVLGVLARELPKLMSEPGKASPHQPAYADEARSWKRRRVQGGEDAWEAGAEFVPPLPNEEVLQAIITAYFCHVHPWIPMIHQGRFRRRMNGGRERTKLNVVLHAMNVSSSKFLPAAGKSTDAIAHTRRWVVATAIDHLCLEHLQALIIVAYTDIGDGNAAKAWSIIGSLTRTVEYSQLAQECENHDYELLCQPLELLEPTSEWTEIEERRRVFWNVFNLDRFCSVAMGWNTSLTSDDVHRRLPCDGHLWRKEQPVVTPYFGIWDKSAKRIGFPIGFLVEDDGHPSQTNANPITDSNSESNWNLADVSNVGAFAYRIEATESMSRVSFQIRVMDYTNEISHTNDGSYDDLRRQQSNFGEGLLVRTATQIPITSRAEWMTQQAQTPSNAEHFAGMGMSVPNVEDLDSAEFDTLPKMMLDQQFVNMDRIIAFDDGSMFASTTDTGIF
ncbi:hypothetical protein N0V90_002362 [Kalmusia sp. IMI 367209]|nr:hypothetical protein N0V90_002362 [Kalmusia sp. IMI 367209]